ncbi:hypothetical protein Tco_1111949 [Tanacetum coccineum]|uniref:Uncharacterized protein n=1 Tax=Tanacetum coccineum TaxID=301880 RepID=A0ABQ5IPC5_9ASTR
MHDKTMIPRSCLRWKPTSKIFKTVGLRWVPIGKIFTSSTTKVNSEPTNGLDEDITNQYEYEQTLDVNSGTPNLSAAMTSDHNILELGIHDHNNKPSSLKLVPKVVPPADKTTTSRQELELLFHHHITMLSLIHAESNSLPHAHTQATKTYYKHQDSRINKAQELNKKTSTNSDIQDLSKSYQDYQDNNCQGRLLASFQDDAWYEHVGQDIRSQDGKDNKTNKEKI